MIFAGLLNIIILGSCTVQVWRYVLFKMKFHKQYRSKWGYEVRTTNMNSLNSIFFKSNIQYMVRTVTVGNWAINVNYLFTSKRFECSILMFYIQDITQEWLDIVPQKVNHFLFLSNFLASAFNLRAVLLSASSTLESDYGNRTDWVGAIYQGIVPTPVMTIIWSDGQEFLKSSSYYLWL